MKLNIGVIIGSTRPGRNGAKVAEWFKGVTDTFTDAKFTWIDLENVKLPFFDEPMPPSVGQPPEHEHTRKWAAQIAPLDGVIVITPEYNRGPSAVLKNALDFLNKEWNRKPIAFVGYGANGGVRAIEQLRSNSIELRMAPIREHVALYIFQYFGEDGSLNIPDKHIQEVEVMLKDLVWWATALKTAREKK
jgi:NAD(P)H-dependent FMN reductase